MAYSKTTWINNSSPPINDTNLNHIEVGIDEAHDHIDNLTTGHDHDGTDSKKVTAANVINVPAGSVAATNVQAAVDELDTEKVNKSTLDAQSILAAVSDNTPVAVTVAAQTLVGRITAGNIDDLSTAQVRTLINVEDGADVTDATNVNAAGAVMESDYGGGDRILITNGAGAVAPISVPSERFIGRVAGGADIEDLNATEALVILGVEAGATKYPDTGEQAFLDADHTKLNGIETGATVGNDYGIPSELTLNNAGGITLTKQHHSVDTYGDAATDNLDSIAVGSIGQTVLLYPEINTRTVTIRSNASSGTGSIYLDGDVDYALSAGDSITLIYRYAFGTTTPAWYEMGRTT